MTLPGDTQPQIRVLHDPSRHHLRDPALPRPIRLYHWEPAHPLTLPAPLIVVSHGTGGSGSDMQWLVHPLVEAGFRVVGFDHHGNNYVDGYEPEGFVFIWERPQDITFALDVLAGESPLGPVGAVGFSLGGYTVAALAGARIDADIIQALMAGYAPLPEIPEFPGVLEALRAKVAEGGIQEAIGRADADFADSRIRAIFQVAPGVGQLLSPASLQSIQVPVEIRWGGADTIAPFDVDTRPYVELIPTAHGTSAGPDVRHEDFFEPDPADASARAQVGQDAVEFFVQQLD